MSGFPDTPCEASTLGRRVAPSWPASRPEITTTRRRQRAPHPNRSRREPMSAITRALLAALPFALGACSHGSPNLGDQNTRPDYIKGTIVSTTYDGSTNDLLTGGLGKTGLAAACPAPAVPATPTVAELRTIAI